MVEKKYFDNSGTKPSSGTTIPVIDNSKPTTKNVRVGMYPSLMGTFNVFTPILTIASSLVSESSSLSLIPFHISHLEYPWNLPSPSTSDEYPRPTRMDMLSHSHDCFDENFPSDESILESMNCLEGSWEELQHRSYILPELE